MIGVSIAMAIWTCGLQMVQRRSKQRRTEATDERLAENVEKQMVSKEQQL